MTTAVSRWLKVFHFSTHTAEILMLGLAITMVLLRVISVTALVALLQSQTSIGTSVARSL